MQHFQESLRTSDIFLLVHGQTVHDAEVENSQSKIIFLEMLPNLVCFFSPSLYE